MTRATILASALGLVVLASGCGESPEDQAHKAGQRIGDAVAKIQQSTSAEAVGRQVDVISGQISSLRDDLPAAYDARLDAIREELRSEVTAAGTDESKIRAAFRKAADELQALTSATNSVVNELRRGVREGFDDALN